MSVYYNAFNLFGKNSYDDYKLIVTHFEGDQGESDSYLGMEPIYSDSANGTVRRDYGARFNNVATPRITVMKSDGSDFTVDEVRKFLKWTTGSRKNSYLELCEWDEIANVWAPKFRFLGRTTMAYQQKLDARTVGLIIEFTTVSPFAFSPVQTITQPIYGQADITIQHDTDDIDTLIYLDTTFTNTNGDSLKIYNAVLDETTIVNNLVANEKIYMSSNEFITSDQPAKTFGSDFNYVYPRFGYGADVLQITGNGVIEFQYIYYIKLGDMTIDVNVSNNGINCDGTTSGGGEVIVVGEVSWDKITEKPDLYTKSEIDTMLKGIVSREVYTKSEIDSMLENFVSDDVYTKSEIDTLMSTIQVNIDEEELNAVLKEILA